MLVEILPFLFFLLLSGSCCVRSTRALSAQSPFTPLHSLVRNEPQVFSVGRRVSGRSLGGVMRHVKIF